MKNKVNIFNIVGTSKARLSLLEKMGIFHVRDLLFYLPRAYRDPPCFVSELRLGETQSVCALLTEAQTRYPRAGLILTTAKAYDYNGALINLTWFNQPYVRFRVGEEYIFYGKISEFADKIQMNVLEYFEKTKESATQILPVYKLPKGITQITFRKWVKTAIYESEEAKDMIPSEIYEVAGDYISFEEALEQIHFPKNLEKMEKARKRLAFEELFFARLVIGKARKPDVPRVNISARELDGFIKNLPFSLTKSQNSALKEICEDF